MAASRLKILIICIVSLLLQGNAVQHIAVYGGVPDLLLIVTVLYTIYDYRPEGFAAAVIFGFLQDICYGRIVGSSALVYMAIGFIMIALRTRVYSENKLVLFFVMAFAAFLFSVGQWGIYVLFAGSNLSFAHVMTSLPGQLLWDYVIILIASFVIDRRRRRSRFMF